MSSFSKRMRMITFRVSEEEYETLKTLYPVAGARSVSEFARSAIDHLLADSQNGNGHGNGHSLAQKIDEIDRRLRLIEKTVTNV